MTVTKLLQVAEFPSQVNGGSRLVFTSQWMWVLYIAKNSALTLANYERNSYLTPTPAQVTTFVIAESVQQGANPTLIKLFDNIFAVLYEDGSVKRSLKMVIIDDQGTIHSNQTLSSNSGVVIQYDYYLTPASFNIVAAYFNENSLVSLVLNSIDFNTYANSQSTLWVSTGLGPTMISSISISRDNTGTARSIIFTTNTNNTLSQIYRAPLVAGLLQPASMLVDVTSTGLIIDHTSVTENDITVIIYSALSHGKSIYPSFFYIYGNNLPLPIQFQSTESITLPKLLPVTQAGDYCFQYVTYNISTHPRSLVRCYLSGLSQAVPNFESLKYTYPLGEKALSLSMGPTTVLSSAGLETFGDNFTTPVNLVPLTRFLDDEFKSQQTSTMETIFMGFLDTLAPGSFAVNTSLKKFTDVLAYLSINDPAHPLGYFLDSGFHAAPLSGVSPLNSFIDSFITKGLSIGPVSKFVDGDFTLIGATTETPLAKFIDVFQVLPYINPTSITKFVDFISVNPDTNPTSLVRFSDVYSH